MHADVLIAEAKERKILNSCSFPRSEEQLLSAANFFKKFLSKDFNSKDGSINLDRFLYFIKDVGEIALEYEGDIEAQKSEEIEQKQMKIMLEIVALAKEWNDLSAGSQKHFSYMGNKFNLLMQRLAAIKEEDIAHPDLNYSLGSGQKYDKEAVQEIGENGIPTGWYVLLGVSSLPKDRIGRPESDYARDSLITKLSKTFTMCFGKFYGDRKCSEFISWLISEVGVAEHRLSSDAVRKVLAKAK